VGYRPTGSSNGGKPLSGAPPRVQNPSKTGINKPIAMKPTQWGNPALKGETCHVPVNMQR